MLCAFPSAASAKPKDIRITGLTDVTFGSIGNLGVDAIRSQSVCVYLEKKQDQYMITAIGSGTGGAFTLSFGAQTLPYEVQWSDTSGQSSGTQLSPNVPLGGLDASATEETCNTGPASDASLVVILRAANLSSATAGSYSGTLTLVLASQ